MCTCYKTCILLNHYAKATNPSIRKPDVDYSIYHHLHVIDMNKWDIRFDELQKK